MAPITSKLALTLLPTLAQFNTVTAQDTQANAQVAGGNVMAQVANWSEAAPTTTAAPGATTQSSDLHPGLQRALLKADMGLVNNYGCWCYFEDNVGKGKGRPVDKVDEICKTLQDGYSCIMSDADEDGNPCIPWEQPYNSAFGGGISPFTLNMVGLVNECDAQNSPNTCAVHTCKVEGWFVQQYFTYAIFGGLIDHSQRHEMGFSVEANCVTVQGNNGNWENGCCGEHPQRYPYRAPPNEKACCVATVYNKNMFSCCNDGQVRLAC